MNKFAQRLREERELNNITRAELAKHLNVSARTVCYWESGQRECDFDTLIKIVEFLDTSIDYLLGTNN